MEEVEGVRDDRVLPESQSREQEVPSEEVTDLQLSIRTMPAGGVGESGEIRSTTIRSHRIERTWIGADRPSSLGGGHISGQDKAIIVGGTTETEEDCVGVLFEGVGVRVRSLQTPGVVHDRVQGMWIGQDEVTVQVNRVRVMSHWYCKGGKPNSRRRNWMETQGIPKMREREDWR